VDVRDACRVVAIHSRLEDESSAVEIDPVDLF